MSAAACSTCPCPLRRPLQRLSRAAVGCAAVHLLTGKSELERILLASEYNAPMQQRFAASLSRSRQLYSLRRLVFGVEEFDVTALTTDIVAAKKMSMSAASFRTRCGRASLA